MLGIEVLLAEVGCATRMMSSAQSWREWGAVSLRLGRLPAPLSRWGRAGRVLSLADVPRGAPARRCRRGEWIRDNSAALKPRHKGY